MRDWIVGLRKSALEARPSPGHVAVAALEAEYGVPLPDELRALYDELDGGHFQAEVILFPLGGDPGVVGLSRQPIEGLPLHPQWRFGLRGGTEHLFAAPKRALTVHVAPDAAPRWFAGTPDDAWLYGLRSDTTGSLSLFRSLEQLLWKIVPPTDADDFGENTFTRALTAVKGALETIQKIAEPPVAAEPSREKSRSGSAAKKKPGKRKRAAAKLKAKPTRGARKGRGVTSKPKARTKARRPARAKRKTSTRR